MVTEKIIPRESEAEYALIGCMFIAPKTVPSIIKKASSSIFFEQGLGTLFNKVVSTYSEYKSIDIALIRSKVTPEEMTQILECMNKCSSSSLWEQYIKKLEQAYTRRQLIELSSELVDYAYDSVDEPTEAILSHARSEIITKLQPPNVDTATTMQEALDKLYDVQQFAAERRESGVQGVLGIETYQELDKYTDGICPGKFWIVSGYTSAGKTAFALNLLIRALRSKKRVKFFSLEMAPQEIMSRMVSIDTGIPIRDIKYNYDFSSNTELSSAAQSALSASYSRFSGYDCQIHHSSSFNAIKGQILASEVLKDTDLIVVDYAQLITSNNNETEYQRLSNVAHTLQRVSRESGIPVILLSQVSQASQQDNNKEVAPTKGSGDLGASADIIIVLRNTMKSDERDRAKSEGRPLEVECHIMKNRDGKTGALNCNFHPDKSTFEFVKEFKKVEQATTEWF